MNWISKFALKNPTVVFFLMAMILVGGFYSASQMKTEAMPDVKIPFVTVSTLYPGASPDDVLNGVTKPIEKATTGIKGLKTLESHSVDSMSILVLQFEFSTDMEQAERQVQEAINKISLPEQAQKSKVGRVSFDDSPVLVLSASGGKSTADLEKTIRDSVQPELSGIPGVGSLDVNGLSDTNIYVKVDPGKLKDKGLTLENVKQALLANNISFPTGEVNMDQKTLSLRVAKKMVSVDDVKAIPIVIQPNATAAIGEGMGQMGKAIVGLAQGMGTIGQQMGILGQGMGQLGQGVGNANQGAAMVAGIQLLQGQMLQDQMTVETLKPKVMGGTATAEEQQQLSSTAERLQANQAKLPQLYQALSTWLTQTQALAQSQSQNTNASTPKPSSGGTKNIEMKSPELKIETVGLGDIATVTSGASEPSSYTRTDEKPSVVINVLKNGDANTVEVTKKVMDKLSELNLDKSITFTTLYDQSKDIKASVNGMLREGLLGALFAVIVIAIFLRNLRATVVAVVSIPLSILTALIILPRFNITLNMMTLGGLAVAVGRVVDDSIVVIENIYRRLLHAAPEERGPKLVWEATKEVSSAITSSTITTVAVFMPLGLVTGIVAKFFFPFALTVVISLLASLLVAITVVPLLSKFMLLNGKLTAEHEGALQKTYKRVLNWSLTHRWAIALISLVLIVAVPLGAYKNLPVQFIPQDNIKAVAIKQLMPPGTSLEATNKVAVEAEKILMTYPQVKTVQVTAGSNKSQMGMSFNVQGSDQAKYMVVLKDNADVDKSVLEIRDKLHSLEQNEIKFVVTAQTTTGPGDSVEVIVNGPDVESISKAATMITTSIKDVPDLVNVTNNLATEKPEISVTVNAEKAAEQGYNPIMVAGMIRSMLMDTSVTTLDSKDGNVNIQLSLKQDDLNSLEKISDLELPGMKANFKLKDIAEIKKAPGPVSITQRNGKQFANITAGVVGHNTQGVTAEVVKRVEALKGSFPTGVTYSLGGANENIEEGFSQMGVAIAIAIGMVYLVMVIAFGGALAPLSILFSLPFAAVGGLLGLLVSHQSISMPALIGMLMLIGIVVTNAIVLVDRVQTNRKAGMSINDALLEAGSIRLRPILMTAIATIMALLPLALGFSEGTIISVSLGVVVIGGLTLSTLLTLVVVPVAYSYMEGLKLKFTGDKPPVDWDATEAAR